MHLNYYASEGNDLGDNPPIRIVFYADRGAVVAEYALGGLLNNIFASSYVLYVPDKKQLIVQVEKVLGRRDEENAEI